MAFLLSHRFCYYKKPNNKQETDMLKLSYL